MIPRTDDRRPLHEDALPPIPAREPALTLVELLALGVYMGLA